MAGKYSFNGHVLPGIYSGLPSPSYPYIAILEYSSGNYRAVASSLPLNKASGTGAMANTTARTGYYAYWFFSKSETGWGAPTNDNARLNAYASASPVAGKLIWANYDVYDAYYSGSKYLSRGTLILEASDPIPWNTAVDIVLHAPKYVCRGSYAVITAQVTGNGEFDETCTAEIGGAGDGSVTTITKLEHGENFLLYSASDETAESVAVTVTNTENPEINATTTLEVVGDFDTERKRCFMAGLSAGLALYSAK